MAMTDLKCVICDGEDLVPLSAAMGEQAYCRTCLHAWRITRSEYPYAETAMCAHDMGRARYEAQVEFFAPFAPADASILELGCATGELAVVTRQLLSVKRYDAVEMSPAREKARAHVDRLFTEPLPDLLRTGQVDTKYDLVLMSHVFEHLEDPGAELRAMQKVLNPDGVIFIEVPNRSGNPRLPIDDNLAHLHFFTASSLSRLLAREGLETTAIRTGVRLDARCTDAMQVVARRFALPTWSKTRMSDHPLLGGASDIVVWGAGGLVEILLANYFDPARIDFFIDRNGGKRDWVCLGRPIRGPEALGPSPRTVLINSVDFADSIAADLERLYPGAGHRVVRIADLF